MVRPTFKLIHQVNSGKGIRVSLSLKTVHAQLQVTAIKVHVQCCARHKFMLMTMLPSAKHSSFESQSS